MADKKHKTQTGGLQEKKVKIPPTKEEIKIEQQEEKAKRKEKRKERKKEKGNFFRRFARRIKDVFGELRKVRWPTFGLTVKKTGIVLAVVLVFSLVVFGIDQGLAQLYKLLTKGFE